MKQLMLILFTIGLVFQGTSANPCPANNRYAQPPDGCSGLTNPNQVRDTWGPVDFRQACNEHDKCYYTLGTSEVSCNDAFNKRLLTACRDGLRKCRTIYGKRYCTPPEPASYSACASVAESMYLAVRATSRAFYREAQDKQRKHEQKCAEEKSRSGAKSIFNPWLEKYLGVHKNTQIVMWPRNTGAGERWQVNSNGCIYNPWLKKYLGVHDTGEIVMWPRCSTGEKWQVESNGCIFNPFLNKYLGVHETGEIVMWPRCSTGEKWVIK